MLVSPQPDLFSTPVSYVALQALICGLIFGLLRCGLEGVGGCRTAFVQGGSVGSACISQGGSVGSAWMSQLIGAVVG